MQTQAKIRYDWISTPNGYRGGLNVSRVSKNGNHYPTFGQRTEFSDLMVGEWEELKAETRKIAEIYFKRIHPYDGEYVAGLVLVEWIDDYKKPYRMCSFKNLCAVEFGKLNLPKKIVRNMGYRI